MLNILHVWRLKKQILLVSSSKQPSLFHEKKCFYKLTVSACLHFVQIWITRTNRRLKSVQPGFAQNPEAHINSNLGVSPPEWETHHCVPPLHFSTTSSLVGNLVVTFGSSERSLWSFASIAAVVLIKGQTVLPGPCHHFGVWLEVLGPAQGFGSVDLPGVRVWHVQLASNRISGQVISVRRVVAAFKTIAQLYISAPLLCTIWGFFSIYTHLKMQGNSAAYC